VLLHSERLQQGTPLPLLSCPPAVRHRRTHTCDTLQGSLAVPALCPSFPCETDPRVLDMPIKGMPIKGMPTKGMPTNGKLGQAGATARRLLARDGRAARARRRRGRQLRADR